MTDDDLRDTIQKTIADCISDFFYYDRKEDEALPRGAIEAAIAKGVITPDWIVSIFAAAVKDHAERS